MGFLHWGNSDEGPDARAASEAGARRQAEFSRALAEGEVPPSVGVRLERTRSGKLPWVATLTPAELRIAADRGIRPISAIVSTCWMQAGWPWTHTHGQGWERALRRMGQEAKAAGANAVLDVRMRHLRNHGKEILDFTLVGTAVRIEGLPSSASPVIVTLPALEFTRLVDAGMVPTGLAMGVDLCWMSDLSVTPDIVGRGESIEVRALSDITAIVRKNANAMLRELARPSGDLLLAHVESGDVIEHEKRLCACYLVIATTVDTGGTVGAPSSTSDAMKRKETAFEMPVRRALDLCAGRSRLASRESRHTITLAGAEERLK